MDIITLHVRLDDVLVPILVFVEDFDCESVGVCHLSLRLTRDLIIFSGDPQTALEYLGNVILFLQATLVKYQVKCDLHFIKDQSNLTFHVAFF